jgi:hypothetical protein
VSSRPNNTENISGIGGSILAGPWVFLGVWHLVDWIGRAQTAMAITPYLGIFASPIAFLLEFIGAVGLLFYATRLEHAREADAVPLIIKPYADPKKPKRHWFWLKIASCIAAVSVIAGVGTGAWLKARIQTAQTQKQNITTRSENITLTSKTSANNTKSQRKSTVRQHATSASISLTPESWSDKGVYTWKHNLNTTTPALSCFEAHGLSMAMPFQVIDKDTITIPRTTVVVNCTLRK